MCQTASVRVRRSKRKRRSEEPPKQEEEEEEEGEEEPSEKKTKSVAVHTDRVFSLFGQACPLFAPMTPQAHATSARPATAASAAPTPPPPLPRLSVEGERAYFAALLRVLRAWEPRARDALAAANPTLTPNLERFLWFSSACAQDIAAVFSSSSSSSSAAAAAAASSLDVARTLATELNDVAGTIPTAVFAAFPTCGDELTAQSDAAQLSFRVEKQVYRTMPLGCILLPLRPRPFATSDNPWVSPAMTRTLDCSQGQLVEAMRTREGFLGMFDTASISKITERFWSSVADAQVNRRDASTPFSVRFKTVDKTFLVTLQLTLDKRLPVRMALFLQEKLIHS